MELSYLVKTNTKFETHMDRRDFLKKSAVLTAAATVPGMAFAGERQHIQGNGTSQEGQHIHGNNTAGEASEGDGAERKLIDTPPMLQNYAATSMGIAFGVSSMANGYVDEFAIETIRTYSDKEFQSISRGDLDLDDAESQEAKKETEEIAKNNDDLVKDIKEVLGDKVAEVKISSRLKSGAVCLVADANCNFCWYLCSKHIC